MIKKKRTMRQLVPQENREEEEEQEIDEVKEGTEAAEAEGKVQREDR